MYLLVHLGQLFPAAMLRWFDAAVDKLDDLQTVQRSRLVKNLVLPGDVFSQLSQFVRGHGTSINDQGQLVASVAGVARQVNKLICVEPLDSVFNGQIGDTVVGRVTEVLQKRWKVDINARRHAVLPLTSVNLPGGELRRKSEEDERLMRTNLCEGDLVSAEVQSVFGDGSLALQTRSLKYGKLFQGVLVKVAPCLVKRCRFHFVSLPCEAFVIFGLNGYIWISPGKDPENVDTGSFVDNSTAIELKDFETIARLRLCVLILAKHKLPIYHKTLQEAYTLSQSYETSDLLNDDPAWSIAEKIRQAVYSGKIE